MTQNNHRGRSSSLLGTLFFFNQNSTRTPIPYMLGPECNTFFVMCNSAAKPDQKNRSNLYPVSKSCHWNFLWLFTERQAAIWQTASSTKLWKRERLQTNMFLRSQIWISKEVSPIRMFFTQPLHRWENAQDLASLVHSWPWPEQTLLTVMGNTGDCNRQSIMSKRGKRGDYYLGEFHV